MNINQRKSYTEMLEILNNMSSELISKIPNSLIEKMNSEKDPNWNFKYDKTVTLEKQKLLHSTKALYSYIYVNYIANEAKRQELKNIYEKNSKIKYNPDNLFKRKNIRAIQENNANDMNTDIVTENCIAVTEEKWQQKVFNIIKSIFKKK